MITISSITFIKTKIEATDRPNYPHHGPLPLELLLVEARSLHLPFELVGRLFYLLCSRSQCAPLAGESIVCR